MISTLLALFSGTAPASAQSGPYVVAGADLFWCTSRQPFCTNSTVASGLPEQPVELVCWRSDRDPFNPTGTSKWFYVYLANGQEGYLWSLQVRNDTTVAATPDCSTINWIQVSDWAIGRIGQTDTTLTSTGTWSGWCGRFAHKAWDGHTLGGATALQMYQRYAPQVRTSRPPRGALVFWPNASADGHVAISLGNWRAVGTQGNLGQRKPVWDYGVNGPFGTSAGWAMPQTPTVPVNPS